MDFLQTISDKVDPEELDGDEGFWNTESSSEEDADNFTNVGRDEVSDELETILLIRTTNNEYLSESFLDVLT